jgi:hypothetical protein
MTLTFEGTPAELIELFDQLRASSRAELRAQWRAAADRKAQRRQQDPAYRERWLAQHREIERRHRARKSGLSV